jgi:hypothetical protein
MSRWMKVAIVAGVIAIVGVVGYEVWRSSRDAAWADLAQAEADGYSIESLEDARDGAPGSPAEPWIDYRLAMALYMDGTPDDFERARQVTSAALAEHPKHALAPYFRKLDDALKAYP